ncbi:hypothetical protein [Clostridium pasteurianum]|uniref:RES domain-containing protein n=1 Tax=Clostridium pasteurianum BC1 TaxID=86416 RepID=R4KB76_CLOPA|nr:hypothetical protein [Clostridium pasteurianum]AGK97784.1 hypothetical protein Clopa_2950 [Clostridium pasteurianum BC1]
MDSVKEHLLFSYIEYTYQFESSYYRIRPTEENKVYSSQEMLHIPYDKRQYASQGRFSLPGIPCTYMSTQPILTWYECNLPQKFNIVKYHVNEDEHGKYKMLYLNINPLLYFHDVELSILNHGPNMEAFSAIRRACRTIPLIAACSLIVKNRNAGFVEEYIIPQMLMSWVRQDKDFIGIRYNTANFIEEAKLYNAHNIVIPAKDYDGDGYCKFLKSLFIAKGDAKVVCIDTVSNLNCITRDIELVYQYYENLKYDFQTSKVELPYDDILTICRTLLNCWECLTQNYQETAILSFQVMKSLRKYSFQTIRCLKSQYDSDYSDFFVSDHQSHLLTYDIKQSVKEKLKFFENHVNCKVLDAFIIFESITLFEDL